MKNYTAIVRYGRGLGHKSHRTYVGANSERAAVAKLRSEGFTVRGIVQGIRHK